MGLHVREIDVKLAEVALSIGASAPLLIDTDWLQAQYSKRLFVFNILCIGKCLSSSGSKMSHFSLVSFCSVICLH